MRLDLAWVRTELRELGIPPLKRFGQHFLLSEQIRETLVDSANLTHSDTVIEVGAGLGFLTSSLAQKAGHVVAVEKDRTLAKHLREKFSIQDRVEVIQGDGLTIPFPVDSKVVSSPPYNISSKLVLRIIKSKCKLACLLLQQDFVRRLVAKSGSRDYGRLTVILQTAARAEDIMHVPRSSFYPEPRVDSAIVKISPSAESSQPIDLLVFDDLVRAMFTQRRRKLRGVLTRYLSIRYGKQKAEAFSRNELNEKRVYELTPPEFVELSNLIAV